MTLIGNTLYGTTHVLHRQRSELIQSLADDDGHLDRSGHALAAFANGSTTLDLNFGTVQLGSGTQDRQFQIENLPATYRAGLALESVMALSDPSDVSARTQCLSPTCLPADSGLMDLSFSPSQLGKFSGQYRLNFSDEQDLSGWAGGQTLTLNVTAEVVPEPSVLALLGVAALGIAGYALRKRRRDAGQIA